MIISEREKREVISIIQASQEKRIDLIQQMIEDGADIHYSHQVGGEKKKNKLSFLCIFHLLSFLCFIHSL